MKSTLICFTIQWNFQSSAPWGALHTPWPWRRKSFVSLPQHVKDINQRGALTYLQHMHPTCLARCEGPKEINHFIRRTTIRFIKHQLQPHRLAHAAFGMFSQDQDSKSTLISATCTLASSSFLKSENESGKTWNNLETTKKLMLLWRHWVWRSCKPGICETFVISSWPVASKQLPSYDRPLRNLSAAAPSSFCLSWLGSQALLLNELGV